MRYLFFINLQSMLYCLEWQGLLSCKLYCPTFVLNHTSLLRTQQLSRVGALVDSALSLSLQQTFGYQIRGLQYRGLVLSRSLHSKVTNIYF
jgi:hypothetical protein